MIGGLFGRGGGGSGAGGGTQTQTTDVNSIATVSFNPNIIIGSTTGALGNQQPQNESYAIPSTAYAPQTSAFSGLTSVPTSSQTSPTLTQQLEQYAPYILIGGLALVLLLSK